MSHRTFVLERRPNLNRSSEPEREITPDSSIIVGVRAKQGGDDLSTAHNRARTWQLGMCEDCQLRSSRLPLRQWSCCQYARPRGRLEWYLLERPVHALLRHVAGTNAVARLVQPFSGSGYPASAAHGR